MVKGLHHLESSKKLTSNPWRKVSIFNSLGSILKSSAMPALLINKCSDQSFRKFSLLLLEWIVNLKYLLEYRKRLKHLKILRLVVQVVHYEHPKNT